MRKKQILKKSPSISYVSTIFKAYRKIPRRIIFHFIRQIWKIHKKQKKKSSNKMFLEFHLMCFFYIFTELFCLDVIALMLFEYENNFWYGNNLDLLEFYYFSEVNFLKKFLRFSFESAWSGYYRYFPAGIPF